jgi:hypothetical protein
MWVTISQNLSSAQQNVLMEKSMDCNIGQNTIFFNSSEMLYCLAIIIKISKITANIAFLFLSF